MLNENAKKLVAALRSGKFKQGTNRLRTKNTFCCLGVACEIAAQEGVIGPAYETMDGYYYQAEENYLPKEVQKYFGFTSRTGSFDGSPNNPHLAAMNDSGSTFEQIADKIESEPEGLFAE